MNASPLISIGLPVYNGEQFLERALKSLFGQTYGDFELLISDNGSSDRTQEICQDYQARDQRVIYWRHDRNRGAAWSYNFTVERARGTFFKWAAHDDECAPQFLAKCLECFHQADETTVLCYPRTLFIDAQGAVFAKFDDNLSLISEKPRQRLYRLLRVILRCNPVFGLIRREALCRMRLIGSYIGSDKVLLAELSLIGKFREIPDYLFLRRMHAGISTAAADSDKELLDWFAPGKRRTPFSFSRLKLASEYVRAVARAQLSAGQRRECFTTLWRLANTRRAEHSGAFAQKLMSIDGDEISKRITKVRTLLDAGDSDAAYHACREVLSLRPWTTPALHLMSVIHLQRGEFSAAREAALGAIWRNDREAAFHNALGIIEQKLGNTALATAAFERAIDCNAAYSEAYQNLSLLSERAGDLRSARAYREKAQRSARRD